MEPLFSSLSQFGAVAAVCGVLLWLNWKHQGQMSDRLHFLENELLTVVKQNTEALQELKKRPCMQEDRTNKRERKSDNEN